MKTQTLESKKKKVLAMIQIFQKLFPEPKTFLSHTTEWEFLIAIILSAQCTDAMVNKVTPQLFTKYKKVEDYASAPYDDLCFLIRRTGFYRMKATYIQKTAKIILKDFYGKVPHTLDNLLSLPGVGRKTALVFLGNITEKNIGIAIDTHVIRLSRLFGLSRHINPFKIEKDLIRIIPRKYWTVFTNWMILYGRTYQPARKKNVLGTPFEKILTN